jgi:hypothetical protein
LIENIPLENHWFLSLFIHPYDFPQHDNNIPINIQEQERCYLSIPNKRKGKRKMKNENEKRKELPVFWEILGAVGKFNCR